MPDSYDLMDEECTLRPWLREAICASRGLAKLSAR